MHTIVTRCNTLQHTVTQHKTLQCNAIHCTSQNQASKNERNRIPFFVVCCIPTFRGFGYCMCLTVRDTLCCSVLQCVTECCRVSPFGTLEFPKRPTYRLSFAVTHCNTFLDTATHCNTLQRTTTHYNTLQHDVAHYNTLRRAATNCSITHTHLT